MLTQDKEAVKGEELASIVSNLWGGKRLTPHLILQVEAALVSLTD
jgi:hypothetical protein